MIFVKILRHVFLTHMSGKHITAARNAKTHPEALIGPFLPFVNTSTPVHMTQLGIIKKSLTLIRKISMLLGMKLYKIYVLLQTK